MEKKVWEGMNEFEYREKRKFAARFDFSVRSSDTESKQWQCHTFQGSRDGNDGRGHTSDGSFVTHPTF